MSGYLFEKRSISELFGVRQRVGGVRIGGRRSRTAGRAIDHPWPVGLHLVQHFEVADRSNPSSATPAGTSSPPWPTRLHLKPKPEQPA
jgi:hypothetical protein